MKNNKEMEVDKKKRIIRRQEYEYLEQKKGYELSTSKKNGDNFALESQINYNITNFLKNHAKDATELILGFNSFRKDYQHKMLNEISNNFKSSLHPDYLFIDAKFMNLSVKNYNILTNLIKIADHSLQSLNIELKGNYLQIEGLSKILIEISEYFPQLKDLTIFFTVNGGYSEKNSLQGLISLLNMKNLQEITIDLDQTRGINSLFSPIQDYNQMNNSVKSIDLTITNTEINLDLLSKLFYICQNLENFKLDLTQSKIENEMSLIKAISLSKLKSIEIKLFRSQFITQIKDILDQLFLSKYLNKINLNFRFLPSNLQNISQIFENLNQAKNLEQLDLNLYNDQINEEDDIKCFAKQIKSDSLRRLTLNFVNDYYQIKIRRKKMYCLESAILSMPCILYACMNFSSPEEIHDSSKLLYLYSKDIKRLICSYISFRNQIQEFMIVNPNFIFTDLYF